MLDNLPQIALSVLRVAGGILLLWFAVSGYHQWKQGVDSTAQPRERPPRTLIQAATVNILNPNPYLGWMLVLGPAFFAAWNQTPAAGIALLVSFYGTTVAALASTVLVFGTTRFLTLRSRRILVLISALLLAVLGIAQLGLALRGNCSNGREGGSSTQVEDSRQIPCA
jgi:threonine/homoserine/homoserine lactone efflux protein